MCRSQNRKLLCVTPILKLNTILPVSVLGWHGVTYTADQTNTRIFHIWQMLDLNDFEMITDVWSEGDLIFEGHFTILTRLTHLISRVNIWYHSTYSNILQETIP